MDFHVIQHFYNNSKDTQESTLSFWISPNNYLSPDMSMEQFYTGDIKYHRVQKKDFYLKNRVKLSFDNHFNSKIINGNDLLQWPFLVATTKYPVQAHDTSTIKKELIQDLDDFLLLTSFVSRYRTTCLGWGAVDQNNSTQFYRGNSVYPKNKCGNDQNDAVIDFKHFNEFISICYPAMQNYENKEALQQALYKILHINSATVEFSYLRLFTGLETLILDFRRNENLELILSNGNDWRSFENKLKAFVKNLDEPKLTKQQRKSIYPKIKELNRVSLREAYILFCNELNVDLSDLWPLFEEKKKVGLVDIRNKLIHGDPLPKDSFRSLEIAYKHLGHTFERVLLRILGWDIEKSNVSPKQLDRKFNLIRDFSEYQTKFSKI